MHTLRYGSRVVEGFFVKDTKSKAGTFLNQVGLSTNTESGPFQIKDGDILQLGVDYQGEADIYKRVKIKIELGREWQASANAFKYVPFDSLLFLLEVTEYGFSTNALKNLKTLALPGSNEKQGKSDIKFLHLLSYSLPLSCTLTTPPSPVLFTELSMTSKRTTRLNGYLF